MAALNEEDLQRRRRAAGICGEAGSADGGEPGFGGDKLDPHPRGDEVAGGGIEGAPGAEFAVSASLEADGDFAARLAAVEANVRDEPGLEPAAEAEAGQIMALFGDGAEVEEGLQDGLGVVRTREQEPEIEGDVERLGIEFGLARDGGEELVDDGNTVIERTGLGDRKRGGGGESEHRSETQSQ